MKLVIKTRRQEKGKERTEEKRNMTKRKGKKESTGRKRWGGKEER